MAGVLIAISFIQTYAVAPRLRDTNEHCAPGNPAACDTAGRFSKIILWVAATIYGVGFFVAYILGPILSRLDTSG